MPDPIPKTVLVTGANGYIGNAVARSFVRAGWTTYGLVRNRDVLDDFAASEIIPLLGSPADQAFLRTLPSDLTFDVIVSTTEQITNYMPHYNEIVSLLTVLARKRLEKGLEQSLVLFTSGCKDYGMMDLVADSSGLMPHTEESPIKPPPFATGRATNARFRGQQICMGCPRANYGDFFRLAEEAKEKGVLELNEHPKTILHAMHVDDCADAYVALAQDGVRSQVAVECFNISSYRFETLEEIAGALAVEYGFQEVKWGPITEGRPDEIFERAVLGFSQWTGSDKSRKLTGFRDQRQLFSKGLHQYRLAYEVANGNGYQTKGSKMMAVMEKGI